MSTTDEWSPDDALEPGGAEALEPWDEALDDEDDLDPEGTGAERAEGERSLDRQLVVDDAELEEAGAELDDPEGFSVLDGGIDDPDGAGQPAHGRRRLEDDGWDLDA